MCEKSSYQSSSCTRCVPSTASTLNLRTSLISWHSKISKNPKLPSNFCQLRLFLVQIHRVDYKYVEASDFSTSLECQLIGDQFRPLLLVYPLRAQHRVHFEPAWIAPCKPLLYCISGFWFLVSGFWFPDRIVFLVFGDWCLVPGFLIVLYFWPLVSDVWCLVSDF